MADRAMRENDAGSWAAQQSLESLVRAIDHVHASLVDAWHTCIFPIYFYFYWQGERRAEPSLTTAASKSMFSVAQGEMI